jgi:hypothetical protein
VLVWIYVISHQSRRYYADLLRVDRAVDTPSGPKKLYGNPSELIATSQANGSAGVIYVAMNHRLGAFGFLASPTLQSNGTANAGLCDQRLANLLAVGIE